MIIKVDFTKEDKETVNQNVTEVIYVDFTSKQKTKSVKYENDCVEVEYFDNELDFPVCF
jgi:hypothetical protein